MWRMGAPMSLGLGGPMVVRNLPDHIAACLAYSDVLHTRNWSTGGGPAQQPDR
jgi:hypothetical protein